MNKTDTSLQERFAARSICFGCGPANSSGLKINSYPDGEFLVCRWQPEKKYEAFPGFLYGGLIASLLDCHCNWTAAWHLMEKNGLAEPPCTVTAELNVKYFKPTPSHLPLLLKARVTQSGTRSATVEAELFSADELCATCVAVFVAVKEGHPAFHRW